MMRLAAREHAVPLARRPPPSESENSIRLARLETVGLVGAPGRAGPTKQDGSPLNSAQGALIIATEWDRYATGIQV
jgi:hypothetical protein